MASGLLWAGLAQKALWDQRVRRVQVVRQAHRVFKVRLGRLGLLDLRDHKDLQTRMACLQVAALARC